MSGIKVSLGAAIRETQAQTTIRFHVIPIRMAITKRQTTVSVDKGVGKLEPSGTAGGNVQERSYLLYLWKYLKRLNTVLPYDLAITILGVYPTDMKTYVHTKTGMLIFTADYS